MRHHRTSRVIRLVRWTRLMTHLGWAAFMLRFLYPRADGARRRELGSRWSQDLLALLAIRLECEGDPPQSLEDGALIAANHVSWLDVFAIGAVRHTRFVAKSEIRDWPVAGMIAERAGTIFVHRARRHDTGRIATHVKDALAAVDCVGLFPEGTTTEGDQLLKFHSSLFEPAVANGTRVHPVAVRYLHPDGTPCLAAAFVGELTFAQSLGLVIRTREMVVRVAFAPPVEPAGRNRREIAGETQQRIASLLGIDSPDSEPGRAGGP